MERGTEAEEESKGIKTDDCSFVWDETTQLYFHASGFYHDPVAGWYYSSGDGVYYMFHNGTYVPLSSSSSSHQEVESYANNAHFINEGSFEAYKCTSGDTECDNNQSTVMPPPPSEWLEETLINHYLSGRGVAINAGDDLTMALEMDAKNDINKLEEVDGIAQGHCGLTSQGEGVIDEGIGILEDSRDEENWRLQYGQVVHFGDKSVLDSFVVDLWDWAVVTDSGKGGKDQVARLVGRLVKQSTKLHPSMPSKVGLFRTASICEVQVDLVRVRTGKVYKLRSPSAKYLASLSTYDASNPTKGWGFPELSIDMQDIHLTKSSQNSEPKSADCKDTPTLTNQLSSRKKQRSHVYRDRAAERRVLHSGFGVGPGQKKSLVGDVGGTSSPVPTSSEEAAAEALNISFGVGSYARKILESMGWKEGEALGNTTKGLVEPIQPVGNIGNAGLGWPQGRTNNRWPLDHPKLSQFI